MSKGIEVQNHDKRQGHFYDSMGDVSDGYHTFNELYRYRMLYNAALFNLVRRNAVAFHSLESFNPHKSWKHRDGEDCFGGGWFVVMMTLPTGQISNHYEAKYWDLFKIPEQERADEWDGHTPDDVAKRIEEWL